MTIANLLVWSAECFPTVHLWRRIKSVIVQVRSHLFLNCTYTQMHIYVAVFNCSLMKLVFIWKCAGVTNISFFKYQQVGYRFYQCMCVLHYEDKWARKKT